METPITLIIVAPEGEKARLACASVTLFAMDNAAGENGGSMGIRRGHMPAVIALERGSAVKARVEDGSETVFGVSGGFAKVENDIVTVITGAVNDRK